MTGIGSAQRNIGGNRVVPNGAIPHQRTAADASVADGSTRPGR
jgi:hypothetical protein